jgi:UDP-N-acetylglucosamine 2-epimerase
MKKIITVLGSRPQFIKASAVSHAIARLTSLSEVVVHTWQHFDANMSDVFLPNSVWQSRHIFWIFTAIRMAP